MSREPHKYLERVRRELAKDARGGECNISATTFLEFVEYGPYRRFYQIGQQTRQRLGTWAQKLDVLPTFVSWLPDVEARQPGFFEYPANLSESIEGTAEEFDSLVRSGIMEAHRQSSRSLSRPPTLPHPSPTNDSLRDEIRAGKARTHFPNGKNTLPKSVVEAMPEYAGKTREEAWLLDSVKREKAWLDVMNDICDWCRSAAEHFGEGDEELTAGYLDKFMELTQRLPTNPQPINIAKACIDEDRAQFDRQKKLDMINKIPSYLDRLGEGRKRSHDQSEETTTAAKRHRNPSHGPDEKSHNASFSQDQVSKSRQEARFPDNPPQLRPDTTNEFTQGKFTPLNEASKAPDSNRLGMPDTTLGSLTDEKGSEENERSKRHDSLQEDRTIVAKDPVMESRPHIDMQAAREKYNKRFPTSKRQTRLHDDEEAETDRDKELAKDR